MPWAVARHAPLSMAFPSKEHWTGLPFPPPGDLPHPGMESASPALASGLFTNELPGKPQTAFFYLLYYLGIKILLKLSQLTINIYEKKKKKNKTFKTNKNLAKLLYKARPTLSTGKILS